MNIVRFKRDTSFRNDLFTPESFAHPAKLDSQLLIWIIEKYTSQGETILDPMFGSGTAMLACMLGRNVVGVELEQKFVDMAKANWEKVRQRPQLGSPMGDCQILQGDARNLEGLLVDKCIFSPPYAETATGSPEMTKGDKQHRIDIGRNPDSPGSGYPRAYSNNPDNLGNLPYGTIDSVITSPPYENGTSGPTRSPFWERLAHDPTSARYGRTKHPSVGEGYSVDAILTSPPYENQIHKGTGEWSKSGEGNLIGGEQSAGGKLLGVPQGEDYIKSAENIGNLKSTSYLEAMAQVYQQCHAVLKSGGLMILITKNFIRNQKEVRLDLDTIKLCEQAGFSFLERWYRELPAQSFWRIIYKQKYPDAPELKFEDVLVFVK